LCENIELNERYCLTYIDQKIEKNWIFLL